MSGTNIGLNYFGSGANSVAGAADAKGIVITERLTV